MQISLTTSGLLDKAQLQSWIKSRQDAIRAGVARAMKSTGREIAADAQAEAKRAFRGKAKAAASIRSKVYESKPNEMPALKIGSKIPWLGIHERGGQIHGNMLIPFGDKRAKGFKNIVRTLMAGGNAWFVKVGDHAILFAENIREYDRLLAPFKRFARKQGIAETRGKSGKIIRRGADIPVAILVHSVTIRRKLGMEAVVRRDLPKLARAIEVELNRG